MEIIQKASGLGIYGFANISDFICWLGDYGPRCGCDDMYDDCRMERFDTCRIVDYDTCDTCGDYRCGCDSRDDDD